MLFTDDDVELSKAHIIKRRFKATPRLCTVQRRDVEEFYGSSFQSDALDISRNGQILLPLSEEGDFDLFLETHRKMSAAIEHSRKARTGKIEHRERILCQLYEHSASQISDTISVQGRRLGATGVFGNWTLEE